MNAAKLISWLTSVTLENSIDLDKFEITVSINGQLYKISQDNIHLIENTWGLFGASIDIDIHAVCENLQILS